jgi:hypothetical protein
MNNKKQIKNNKIHPTLMALALLKNPLILELKMNLMKIKINNKIPKFFLKMVNFISQLSLL